MSNPLPPSVSDGVRVILTLDIPVEEILSPDHSFSSDAIIPPEVQARIEQERLQKLPTLMRSCSAASRRFSLPGTQSTSPIFERSAAARWPGRLNGLDDDELCLCRLR